MDLSSQNAMARGVLKRFERKTGFAGDLRG
jgi:hypothetical protein